MFAQLVFVLTVGPDVVSVYRTIGPLVYLALYNCGFCFKWIPTIDFLVGKQVANMIVLGF